MSGTIKDYFNNAQLAQASYAFLNKDLNSNIADYILALEGNKNFSTSQATQFIQQYNIIDDQQNTADGFSATLFQDSVGEYTLAIRGTEPSFEDIVLTDFGDIGGNGIALSQAKDLFNYYQKLITPEDAK